MNSPLFISSIIVKCDYMIDIEDYPLKKEKTCCYNLSEYSRDKMITCSTKCDICHISLDIT